ncbi:MAG: signal peptide peptidase SppA [Mariprofundaceae bacterium]
MAQAWQRWKAGLTQALRWGGRLLKGAVALLAIAVFAAAFYAARPHVPDQAGLVIDPVGPLVEEVGPPSAMEMLLGGGSVRQTDLHAVIAALDHARDDERIRLAVLRLDGLAPTPPARLAEVRRAIKDFRAGGKKVIAVGGNYGQGAYYLASAASEVWLHPLGSVALTGLAWRRYYLKDALDGMHVRVRLFRAGRYKSFGEPLVRNAMSEPAKEEARAWMNGVWRHLLGEIAADRGIEAAAVERSIEDPAGAVRRSGDLARLAVDLGLVDRLLDGWHAEQRLYDLLDADEERPLPLVGFRDYVRALGDDAERRGEGAVGVIVASGAIINGEQPPGRIGAASLTALIRQAMNDASVRAVVLRIDSPGGDAGASEDVRRALLDLKAAGKPLVVSMGGAAASGGYWIASAADEIHAWPTTLTGSIGVFGLFGEIAGALSSLGVHVDGVATSEIAGQPRSDMPMPRVLADVFQQRVDDAYRRFLAIVAEGRGMKPEAVASVAEGRVWSGEDAARIGLVDRLDGLDDAIRAAARRAGLDPAQAGWKRIRRPQGFAALLFRGLAARLGYVAGAMPSPDGARFLVDDAGWAHVLRAGGVQAWIDLPSGI